RILITHGTDTMAQTAEVLKSVADRTIVLTGAMQPARMRRTDAIFNVGFAWAAVSLLPAGGYIAMNGEVFEAGSVRKNLEAQRFERA
ncbi:MAG TPA: asparaginase, partial [Marinobacter hydrocarbonoclasticus]|nr:asparaginase [Marinobacter nauticus]